MYGIVATASQYHSTRLRGTPGGRSVGSSPANTAPSDFLKCPRASMLAAPQSPLTPLQVSMLGRRDSLEIARRRTPCARDDQGQPTLCSASVSGKDSSRQPVRDEPHTDRTPAKENRKAALAEATPPPSKSGLAIRSLGLSGSARRVRPGPAHPIADRSSPIALNREASGLLGMSAPKSAAPGTPKSALRTPARRVVSTEAAEQELEAAETKAAAEEVHPNPSLTLA